MNTPIQPTAPVNPIITIQPVTNTIPNRESTGAPNPLAGIASGTTVEGFVVNRDAQNNPILRTAIGDLRVTSDVFLKTGSEVIFKVDTNQASLARIISVDGLTPENYATQNAPRALTQDTISATSLQSPLAAPANSAGKPAPAVASAPLLQAIVLQNLPGAAPQVASTLNAAQTATAAVFAQLRPGSPLRLTLLDLKLPPLAVSLRHLPDSPNLQSLLPPKPQTVPTTNAAQAPVQRPATVQQPVATSPTAPNTQPQQPETPADDIAPLIRQLEQQQTAVARTVLVNRTPDALLLKSEHIAQYGKAAASVQPEPLSPTKPQQTPAKSEPTPAQQPITQNVVAATVIGHDAEGANILHTPFATLKLYTTQPLPTGTTLTVHIAPQAEAAPGQLPLTQAPASPIERATGDLASLDEAIQWLQKNQPDIARDLQQRLPNVNHKLASSLLFFIAGLGNTDASSILGKRALRELERSAPDILARIRRDMGQMQATFSDSPLPNWTTLILPMMVGHELQQARLFISKDPPKDDASDKGSNHGQRFILEVGLSALGPMQFDGFVRKGELAPSFNLMVRANQPISDAIREGIQAIFSTSLSISGMHGQVLFQHGPQHFIRPMVDLPPDTDSDLSKPILA